MPPSPPPSAPLPRVLIVSEHASARFGGEAALPLHYFRVLRARGAEAWLVTHERVRRELEERFPEDLARILFIRDNRFHRLMWAIGRRLPHRIAYFTTGYLSRVATQRAQRRLARRVVAEQRIDVIHQPMPVSPREPSLLHGFPVPVVIGPMNGGMDLPPGFRTGRMRASELAARAARWSARLLNLLSPGKPRAETLLVANDRTRAALPGGMRGEIREIVENGVDLLLWGAEAGAGTPPRADEAGRNAFRFVFMGRLVDWKCVDVLVEAFAAVRAQVPAHLTIVGDGEEGSRLRSLAARLGVLAEGDDDVPGTVRFAGWQDQAQCARVLAASDALLLPSVWECGGAVVLEAMACSRPVVAADWGGPADYLTPDCGILVPPRSRRDLVDGFAEAMVRLARDPAAARAMGACGRRRVEAHFDWERKVDEMLEVYRGAIARRASAPAPAR